MPSPDDARASELRLGQIVLLLLLLEALAVACDLAFGGYDAVSTEERFNAQAAAQLACGHLDRILDLRYRPFCGGCTAEALLAAPLYRLLGPTVLAWKLVPAGLHLLTVCSGAVLAGRIGGRRAAVAWGVLILGAPAAWRSLALTGFGNHVEVMALVLASAATLALALDQPHWWTRWSMLLLAGMLAGLGISFAYSAAFGALALCWVALARARRGGIAALLGLGLGLGPLWWQFSVRPDDLRQAQVSWAAPTLAPPLELWRFLFGDFVTGSLWPLFPGGALSTTWWIALWVLGLSGALWAWRQGGVARWPLLAIAALLLAFFGRYDLWQDNPAVIGFDPFNLRYRIPLLMLLVLCSALAASGRGPRGRIAQRLALALGLVGLVLRGTQWRQAPADLQATVLIPGFHADATVPEGVPARRVPRLMGRSQDIAAAVDFLASHQDPLPACRDDHVAELGRRAGLALQAKDEVARRSALRALAQANLDPQNLVPLAQGLNRASRQAHDDDGDIAIALRGSLPDLAQALQSYAP